MAAGQVGEAYIVVRAITTGVANDIKKGFNGIDDTVADKAGRSLGKSFFDGFNRSGSNNIFGKIADGIATMVPDADAARQSFVKLTKGGFYLQTALSTLVGALAAVGGGIVALAGTAIGALPSFAALANIMVALKLGTGVAKFALGGVGEAVQQASQLTKQYGSVAAAAAKQMRQLAFDAEEASLNLRRAGLNLEQARENLLASQQLPPNSRARREAELAYEEADLAFRRAQEADKEAQKQKKRGAKGGANDPFAKLTPSQKKFAQFMVGLQKQLEVLREAAASGFLPILQTQIQRLNASYFPVLVKGFKTIGSSVGGAVKSITDMLTKTENVGRIGQVFSGSSVLIRKFGVIISKALEAFLKILVALQPTAERFLNFLTTKLTDFNKTLDKTDLGAFFKRSGDIAADFGTVFGNVFDAIGGIVQANFGPDSGGQYLLDWLKDATGQWASLNDTVGGQESLKQYFKDVAVNAKIIFQTVGKFFSELKGIGSDPALGQTFTVLQEAAPFIGDIFKNGVKAGPALAAMAVEVAKFISILADSEQPKIFFETITAALKTVNDVLSTEAARAILSFIGRITAVLIAFGSIIGAAKFFGKVFLGSIQAVFGPLGKMIGYFKNVGGLSKFQEHILKVRYGFENLSKKAKSAYETIVLKGMYARDKIVSAFETMRLKAMYAKDKIVEGFKAVGNWGKNAGSKIVASFKSAGSWIGRTAGAIGNLTKQIALNTIAVFKNIGAWIAQKAALIGATIAQAALRVATLASNIATSIATGIQAAFNAVMALNPIYLIVIAIAALVAALVYFFTQTEIGQQMWQAFTDFLVDTWNNVMGFFAGLGQWFGDLWDGIVGGVQAAWDGVSNFFRGLINGYIGLWEGFINFLIDGLNGLLESANTGLGFLGDLIGQELEIALIPRLQLPRLAKGGVVSPSAGGSLVNVAEAGKPERIEPLDENGLSKRDKAMIDKMSGGVTINMTVNAPPNMDVNELTSEISRRLAFGLRRGATAV